ncbi:MAG: hypothetical protein KTR14_04785 [Vampirovibrio sp.]|nr:hypothetical protein [Vampirovibrio sp.]
MNTTDKPARLKLDDALRQCLEKTQAGRLTWSRQQSLTEAGQDICDTLETSFSSIQIQLQGFRPVQEKRLFPNRLTGWALTVTFTRRTKTKRCYKLEGKFLSLTKSDSSNPLLSSLFLEAFKSQYKPAQKLVPFVQALTDQVAHGGATLVSYNFHDAIFNQRRTQNTKILQIGRSQPYLEIARQKNQLVFSIIDNGTRRSLNENILSYPDLKHALTNLMQAAACTSPMPQWLFSR